MTNELWPVGTWVASDHAGPTFQPGATFQIATHIKGKMWATQNTLGEVCLTLDSKEGYTELPPLPDEEALRKQGYRLTGMAADCSEEGNDRTWVSAADEKSVFSCYQASGLYFNGWRWLVERIEEEEKPESKIRPASKNYDELAYDFHMEQRRVVALRAEVEALNKICVQTMEERDTQANASPWIDASERTPDDGVDVFLKLTWKVSVESVCMAGFFLSGTAWYCKSTAGECDMVDESMFRIQWMEIQE